MPHLCPLRLRSIALAALAALSPTASALAADADHPIVVELFQSQGCSSCPPANAVLNSIADRPDILALSFAVTYWDRLGWKDIYGHPAYTARQWEYSKAGGRHNVSTPQMIVNGRGVLVGSNKAQVDSFIKRYDRGGAGPGINANGARVSIGEGPAARPANVWLIRYDPRTHQVPIRAGENGGRTLPHKNIVREVHLLGKWSGDAASFPIRRSGNPVYRSAVLVQDGPGGAILAARRISR
ncbi:MAG: DUF1223 domain-containing protein [Pseudomonadota bacterium]|nr:DUF1223 domain-containing protein [Pseudomonadota bacterium]